ncbi:MAG: L,D-transpeptidase family protein [Armatimonadota bacterium]
MATPFRCPYCGRKHRPKTGFTGLIASLALVFAFLLAAVPAAAQEELARSLSRLPAVFGRPETYQRKGTESIYRIARSFGVSASAIHNANSGDLNAGGELLLIPKQHIAPLASADGIVVNLTERGLYLYQRGRPARYFPVAIGMRGWETPTGEFTITTKAKNPTWFPPSWAVQEEPVPPGPDNPLGDRWMGLSIKGYGIHATNAPRSIGSYTSHGCMRMYPEQAHELYDLVKVGTPVTIIYRRVLLGYQPETASVHLAYFPDPYEMGDIRPEDVRGLLADYGLDAAADMDAVAAALESPTGLPVAVVGSTTRLLVNGAPVHFALGPTRAGADWLVPAGPLVKALGARIETSALRDYLVISRGAERLFFSPGSPDALVNGAMVQLEAAPQLAARYPLIPLRATVAALGGSVGWDEDANTILVHDGWTMAFPPAPSL